jgi:von Willebrand factor type A domain.
VTREEAPLDLVLLFDMSGSMERAVGEVAHCARQALAQLKEGDRVAVAGFNSRMYLILPFTTELVEVERAIRYGIIPQPFRGSTELHASVIWSAALLAREPLSGRRRAILAITDNQGERGISDDEVAERLWKTESVLCGLKVGTPARERRRPGVEKPASLSGCEMRDVVNPALDFPQMMKRLRERYTIYYTMPPGRPGERREIEVDLAPPARQLLPSARVLARRAYYLPGG